MTIHKGQGKTCDSANINPYCRIPGQLYVALSRVRDLSGLHLINEIKPDFVIASKEVSEFMSHCNDAGYIYPWENLCEKSSWEGR